MHAILFHRADYQILYDTLNHRVETTVGSTVTDFVFNAGGQRVSEWNASTHAQLKGHYYWGSKPVAYYTTASDGGAAVHFEHQDWLGTERMRTAYNGSVEGSYASLPYGDGQTASGTDTDANHVAMLDFDSESDTDHAKYRQYSPTEGRWLRPDPYSGSYHFRNPQSMNRYVYAMNSPLSKIDPSGLDNEWSPDEGGEDYTDDGGWGGDGGYGGNGFGGYAAGPGNDNSNNDNSGCSSSGADFCQDVYDTNNKDSSVGPSWSCPSCYAQMQFDYELESLQFNQLAQLSMHPQGTPGGSNSSGSAPNNFSPIKFAINTFLASKLGGLPSCKGLDNAGDVLEWGGGAVGTAGVVLTIDTFGVGAPITTPMIVGGTVVGFVGLTADKASKHGIGCWE